MNPCSHCGARLASDVERTVCECRTDKIRESRFVYFERAIKNLADAFRIRFDSDDPVPERGEGGGVDEAETPKPDDRYSHSFSS